MKYHVLFYNYGSYLQRQKDANEKGAVCYFELHFNSSVNPSARGIEVLVAHNASEKTIKWASIIASALQSILKTPLRHNNGVKKLKKGERGDNNIAHTKMPAVLVEPCFISNWSEVLNYMDNFIKCVKAMYFSITKMFSEGLVALSVGHKGTGKKGAKIVNIPYYEEDLAEQTLFFVKRFLEKL